MQCSASRGAVTICPAIAQVTGSPAVVLNATDLDRIALGWSARTSLLGKSIYDDAAGEKVGRVDDLILDPKENISYLIVGAGGFVGSRHHDVAIAASSIHEQGGRLTLPGSTRESVKAMPSFDYAADAARRGRFVASAERDVGQAKDKVSELEKKSESATNEARLGWINTSLA